MASVDGTWNIEIKTPIGVQKFTLDLVTNGTEVSGTATDKHDNRLPIHTGRIDGDTAVVEYTLIKPFALPLELTLDVAGDQVTGVGKTGPFPPSKLSGMRVA